MSREIETLLEFHAALGGSAILLSATLPANQRHALAAPNGVRGLVESVYGRDRGDIDDVPVDLHHASNLALGNDAAARTFANANLLQARRYHAQQVRGAAASFLCRRPPRCRNPNRFGQKVQPREWFLVPLTVIAEVIQRIGDGSITEYTYDRAGARPAPIKKRK